MREEVKPHVDVDDAAEDAPMTTTRLASDAVFDDEEVDEKMRR